MIDRIYFQHSQWIYLFAFLFPTLSVFTGFYIFYTTPNHNPTKSIVTISETVIPFPENRIFPVTMNIECVLLFMLLWIRIKLISSSSRRQSIKLSFSFNIAKFMPFAIIFGLSATSSFTLVDNQALHLFAASCFFFGIVIFFMITDSAMKQCHFPIKTFSRMLPYINLLTLVVYMVLLPFNHALGSLLQYLSAFMMFFKVYIQYFDYPSFTITSESAKAD